MKEILYLSPVEIINSWEEVCREYLRVHPAYDLHLGTFPMEARLLNIKYDLDLPVIQNSCSAGKSLYINPSGEAFPCYMIPPIADVVPELKKYMRSWKILTEPISKAEESFESFIKMARAHTQIKHACCADCSERAVCRPCPLIANYDETSLVRCKIARRMTKQLIADIDNSTIPIIRERIEWDISASIIRTFYCSGDYTSEKAYQISPIMKGIWGKVNGIRTIKEIADEVSQKFPHFNRSIINECVLDFVTYFRKEGVIRILTKDR
jgi:radical SAM protein with 4Fe4S-binding SPASM domain